MSEAETGTPKPLPALEGLAGEFYQWCKQNELRFQRCVACNAWRHVPREICAECGSWDWEWTRSSGRGSVYSHTTVHRPPRPEFNAPYVVAIVELEEGWHMLTNLVDCAPEDVAIGLPVEVDFRAVSDEISLPCFRPRRNA